MSNFDFKTDVVDALSNWRFERRLTTEQQIKGYMANVMEELTELHRASLSVDLYGVVDALVDISIFSINAVSKEWNIDFEKFSTDYVDRLPDRYTIETFSNLILTQLKDIKVKEQMDIEDRDRKISNIISICLSYISVLGFNPGKCLKEGIKEITSRTGNYDEKIGKFVKNEGAYTTEQLISLLVNKPVTEFEDYWDIGGKKYDKWYRANYSKCEKETKE